MSDFQPACHSAHTYTYAYAYTGKVRYIKSICWCFCESAVSGHSCTTPGVRSTMPSAPLKSVQKKNGALINCIS